jgi:transposase
MTFTAAAEALRESPRTLKYWVRRYHDKGLAGLRDEKRSGRPPRLTDAQLGEIAKLLQKPPQHSGLIGRKWSGGMLAGWVERHYGVKLSVRQCERVLRTIRMP